MIKFKNKNKIVAIAKLTPGDCFEVNDEYYIRGGSASTEGPRIVGTNLMTGKQIQFEIDKEVLPVRIEATVSF